MGAITVLCPSRNRPEQARAAYASFLDTKARADTQMQFVVDYDDPSDYAGLPVLILGPDETGNMVQALNSAARIALQSEPPDCLAFMGDDHRFRTVGWDDLVLGDMAKPGTGFVYGDDLAQRQNLPTAAFIKSSVVAALGWMAPPWLHHLFVDNSWLAMGHALDAITYDPRIVIEHLHPSFGKGEWDDAYRRVNAPEMYSHDGEAFGAWVENGLQATVDIVRGAL
jgi:hypothetical protein